LSNLQFVIFIFIIIVLVLTSAFFSMAETALMAVNRYRLRHKARIRKRYAIRILHLLKRPDRLLGAILIGNTFANVLASSLATMVALYFWGKDGAFIAAILLTFVILIFSEIAPKTLAALYPERVARWVAYPIQLILMIFYPLVWLANTVTNSMLQLFRVRVTGYAMEPLSREELRSVVYDTTGKISRHYQNMLLSILDLSKLTVDDVIVPHHEIVGIDIEQEWDAIVAQLCTFHQDWVPIYRENINQIIGVLYMHDILRGMLTHKILNKDLLYEQLQEPYFVPEGTPLNAQLGYFQHSHDKVAFVVDEYGEIQGLLTLNDILEEIVGDFTSNITTGKRIHKQLDGSYLVDGAVTIREFNRNSEWELPLRGPRTINGLIVEHLEAMPHIGTAVLISGYPIEIIQVKENRVKQARIFPQLTTPSFFATY
jgi:Mg2+/Co2+ transporter CorB